MLGAPSQAISTSASSACSLVATFLNLTTPTARTVIRIPMLTITTTTTALPENENRIRHYIHDVTIYLPCSSPGEAA